MTDLHIDIDPDALEPGARVAEFEIQRVLGIGGFGIVYLAFDHALERLVALKEYMPSSLAARRSGRRVAVRSQSHAQTFGVGMRSFVGEAKLLARFDHPALLKVYRFWEDNGTAYMAMPYYEGRTLGSLRASMGSPPTQAWLLAQSDALLGALECLHREQVYHRDVAPDNIMVQPDDRPVLLDFGAARQIIERRTSTPTAILKPNFAPIEQYGDAGAVNQGPWSDVYSLAAVLHYCLIGRAPMPATARVLQDELPRLLDLREELVAHDGSRYSADFLAAIDAALSLLPEGRPQTAAQFRARLHGQLQPAAAAPAQPTPPVEAAPRAMTYARTTAMARNIADAAVDEATPQTTFEPTVASAAPVPARAGARRRWPLVAAVAAITAVAALASWQALRPHAPQAIAIETPVPATPAAATAPAAARPASPDAEPTPAPALKHVAAPGAKPAATPTTTATRTAVQLPAPRRTVLGLCGERNPVAKQVCIFRQCRKSEFSGDPQCVQRPAQNDEPSGYGS